MKKFIKKTAFLGVSAATIATIINKSIFDNAENSANKNAERNIYESSMGKISYIVRGEGSPLLLLHNTNIGGSLKEFKRNIQTLSKNFKVYALDLPGFGCSQKQNLTYTAFPYAAILNSFIEDVIKEPSNVVASGGSCTFVASAAIMKPENFLKAVLICPMGIFEEDLPTNSDNSLKTMLEFPLIGTSSYNYFSSKRKLKEYLLNTALFSKENYSDELLDDLYVSAHIGGASSRFSFASEKSKFMTLNILHLLSKTDMPLYILWGMDSEINPPTNIVFFKNNIKNAKYAVFENTKILPHFEKFRQFNNLVTDYLDEDYD